MCLRWERDGGGKLPSKSLLIAIVFIQQQGVVSNDLNELPVGGFPIASPPDETSIPQLTDPHPIHILPKKTRVNFAGT